MTTPDQSKTAAKGATPTTDALVPTLSTRAVWLLWLLSTVALGRYAWTGEGWAVDGLVAVDGLTVVLWTTVTFFSGIVHSYSKRYMAGSRTLDRFFGRVLAFTLAVMVLVAADSMVLFGAAWLAMGHVMAGLIGHVEGWPQAQAAGALARRYFLASSAFLAVALATLWWTTGATTISGVATVGDTPSTLLLVAAGAILLAAMVQSALVPFHTWLLSSMTAPTPASALMHAGFVNAGGVLLVRFAPVVTAEGAVMLAIVLVGALSALAGKLLKSVQPDVKSTLGCSTVGQMGFMIMQAGLGFFGAAITHLVLHGFYKAYHFLSSGSQVAHVSPPTTAGPTREPTVGERAVVVATALAGGVLFAVLTGKGAHFDTGLLLNLVVVLTVLHAAREVVSFDAVPTAVRYGAVPVVVLPALAVYAAVYTAISGLLAGLPAVGQPAELTALHGLVALAFLATYVAAERGVYRHSHRLYVALVNAARPPTETLLTTTEDYNEY